MPISSVIIGRIFLIWSPPSGGEGSWMTTLPIIQHWDCTDPVQAAITKSYIIHIFSKTSSILHDGTRYPVLRASKLTPKLKSRETSGTKNFKGMFSFEHCGSHFCVGVILVQCKRCWFSAKNRISPSTSSDSEDAQRNDQVIVMRTGILKLQSSILYQLENIQSRGFSGSINKRSTHCIVFRRYPTPSPGIQHLSTD